MQLRRKFLSIVGENLSEKARTFKQFADNYGDRDFSTPSALDLAIAGHQLHDVVEKFQSGVAVSLRNIHAAIGTQEEKKKQVEVSVSVMSKTLQQIKRSFRSIELNAPFVCVSGTSSVTSVTSTGVHEVAKVISAPVPSKRAANKSDSPVSVSDVSSVTSTSDDGSSKPKEAKGRRTANNMTVSFANVLNESDRKNVRLADIRVTVDAKSVVMPTANQVGNGVVNGDLGAADRNRDGAPAAKNKNGGAGGADRNAVHSGFGGKCYNCDQPGHLARNCPSASGAGDTSRNVARNGHGGKCYNCDQPGHLARNCSSDSARPRVGNCYNCNQSGHLARDCRNTSGEPRGGNDRHTVEHRRRDTTPAQPRESEDVTAQLRRAKLENAKLKRDLEASERARKH